jgi:hypothetical protein
MGTDAIREIILAAGEHERRTGHLRSRFLRRLQALEEVLEISGDDPATNLVGFVTRYIEYVPVFLDAAQTKARESGVLDYVAPFLHLAEDYFLAPPEEVTEDTGLQALLDEAYLAQRVIEEANDRHIRDHQSPLLPVDMTRANIIVHHLLGDPLAIRLESLVEQSVARLIDRERLFDAARFEAFQRERGASSWEDLPCLSRNARVDLRLAG